MLDIDSLASWVPSFEHSVYEKVINCTFRLQDG